MDGGGAGQAQGSQGRRLARQPKLALSGTRPMSVATNVSGADPAPPSPEEILVERLIVEFELSTAEQLRLHEVRATLHHHGIAPTDAAFARWLSPVFCSSPQEQAQFLARFQELRADVAPPAPRLSVRRARSEPPPPRRRATPEVDENLRRDRRDALVLGLVGAIVLVALGLLILLLNGREIPLPGIAPPPTPNLATPQVRLLIDIRHDPVGWVLKFDLGPWALLGLIPLLFGLTMSAVLLLLLRREQRAFRPTPETSRPVALGAALGDYFGGQEVLRSMLSLARHSSAPGSRLNIRRSLRATVRNAGYPTLRFGARPRIPGYLLLIDREGPRDHLPLVGEMLARRLRRQHAAVTRYAFNRRPRQLANLDTPAERPALLSELTAGVSGARTLVLAETDRLVRPTGEPVDWLEDLAIGGQVTVLDPRAESDWAGDEAALRRAGLAVLPATPDGVRRYADWLMVGGGAPATAPSQPPRLDLPFQLSRHRAMLLSAEPLDEDLIDGLLEDLKTWLGEDLMRLLRALAVFPRLEPTLTLALGKTLKTADGRSCLLNDDSLLRIVRLPWLRAGRMPDQLRERLARDLSHKDLRATVRMVHAFLVSDTEALRHHVSRPPRRPDLLIHWLRQSEDSDLHDPLLIDAIDGRAPDKLATPAAPGLIERLRQAARSPALISIAVAVLAASVAMWVQPLYSDTASSPTTTPSSTSPSTPSLPGTPVGHVGGDASPTTSDPARATSTGGSSSTFKLARIEGQIALNRLARLQEGEGTVYQADIDALREAMRTGDLATIRRIDRATENQIQGYSTPDEGLDTEARGFTVFFPFDQYVLTPEAQSLVSVAAAYANRAKASRILVVGHDDGLASSAAALRISEYRAQAVTSALVALGVDRGIIAQEARGARDPAVITDKPDKEPLNRRVEITVSVPVAQADMPPSGK
ncbi:hypothetical protein AS593_04185 [Caulobacter vibrioides]|nr:hypothetical protein AS593_04185 [Caulobacter vibrioides]